MKGVKVLLVEDVSSDAELAKREIRKELGNCEFFVTETKDGFLSALGDFQPDLIISDFMLPRFDGMTALKIALEKSPEIPFIVLTGSMNEDTAVRCIKAGAWDYVIKEHVKRLGPAVSLALKERKVRLERRRVREALEASERRYHALFTENKSIMLLIDRGTGKIVHANQAALDFYGYKRKQLLSLNIRDIYLDEKDIGSDHSDSGNKDGKGFSHVQHRLSGGEIRDVEEYSGNLVAEGKDILYAVIHDITEKMEYYRNMERSRREAEEANRVKSDFLANISHELRTPLNGLMGMFTILMDLDLGDTGKYWLSMARQTADNLYGIVTDLLDFTSIETGKMNIEKTEFLLEELVEYVLTLFTGDVKEKGLDLQFRNTCPHPVFSGDRNRIAQVLWNLLSNAIKFSETGTVLVEAGEEEGSLILRVTDQGIGIEKEKQEDIFLPFQQLENPYSKKHSGVGLGLSIARNLVELMKGTILVDSEVEKGSCFVVSIPGSFSGGDILSTQEGGETLTVHYKNKKILIVEDEAVNRLYLKILLQKHSFSVLEARDGLEAIEKAEKERPDLILMDIGMPVMNGLEASARILLLPGLEKIPILALTAHAYPADRERFLRSGMVDVVTKPFREATLLKVLERYTG